MQVLKQCSVFLGHLMYNIISSDVVWPILSFHSNAAMPATLFTILIHCFISFYLFDL